MPAFRSVRQSDVPVERTDISFAVMMNPRKLVGCRVLKSRLPVGDVPVWFIDQPQYFDREALYGTSTEDYADKLRAVCFLLSRGVAVDAADRLVGRFSALQ